MVDIKKSSQYGGTLSSIAKVYSKSKVYNLSVAKISSSAYNSNQLSVVSLQMGTHKFRKLNVWQRSIQYVTSIYEITSKFPKEERYGLIDQIRRAAVSISLNIAEGCGAGSNPEFIRFLRMAQRSAYEVIAALEISINLKMADKQEIDNLIAEADELSAMINGLIRSLKADS